MASEPLESYLKNLKLPHKLVAPTTACWKGFYSKWIIDNKKLFLIEWKGFILDYKEVGIKYIFLGEQFVLTQWFSETIRIPMGELLRYVHGGYASVYEGDTYLEFESRHLIKEKEKWLTEKEIKKAI